jgi:hypothetical protein
MTVNPDPYPDPDYAKILDPFPDPGSSQFGSDHNPFYDDLLQKNVQL